MLTIRRDQLAVLEAQVRDGLAGRVAAFLRAERPDAVDGLDEETLLERATIGLSRGWARGMRADVPLVCFAAMFVSFGPGFDRHSTVARVLADGAITPDDLVDGLLDRLPHLVWDELEILGAAAEWNDP